MIRALSIAVLALAGSATAGCVQDSAQATNKNMSRSRIYIGALECNVAGGMGYLIAGARTAKCLFTPETGQPQAYIGTLRDIGIDIGETRPIRMLWKVYSLGSRRGSDALVGTYVGEAAAVNAGSTTGGDWLYGGKDAEIGLAATATFVGDNAGYNIQYAAMTITLSLAS
jgi:uncharacterized protein DUF992